MPRFKYLTLKGMLEDSSAGDEARQRGLHHVGWGRYADDSGKIVAKSKNGKLIDLEPHEPTDISKYPEQDPFQSPDSDVHFSKTGSGVYTGTTKHYPADMDRKAYSDYVAKKSAVASLRMRYPKLTDAQASQMLDLYNIDKEKGLVPPHASGRGTAQNTAIKQYLDGLYATVIGQSENEARSFKRYSVNPYPIGPDPRDDEKEKQRQQSINREKEFNRKRSDALKAGERDPNDLYADDIDDGVQLEKDNRKLRFKNRKRHQNKIKGLQQKDDFDPYTPAPKKPEPIIKKNEGKQMTLVNEVKQELLSILKEATERTDAISKKLEDLRQSLIKDGKITLRERGSARNDIGSLPERRIPLHTVCELIDIPMNELILHFLNGHRIREGQELVEYRLGNVYFYNDKVS